MKRKKVVHKEDGVKRNKKYNMIHFSQSQIKHEHGHEHKHQRDLKVLEYSDIIFYIKNSVMNSNKTYKSFKRI